MSIFLSQKASLEGNKFWIQFEKGISDTKLGFASFSNRNTFIMSIFDLNTDKFSVVSFETVRGTILSLGIMVFVCVLLIGDIYVSLIGATIVAFICVNIYGFLYFTNLHLSPISMMIIILAPVFSIDYTAHVARSFI